jgi:hypothetical protein
MNPAAQLAPQRALRVAAPVAAATVLGTGDQMPAEHRKLACRGDHRDLHPPPGAHPLEEARKGPGLFAATQAARAASHGVGGCFGDPLVRGWLAVP